MMTSAALMLLTTAAIMRSSSVLRCSCMMPAKRQQNTAQHSTAQHGSHYVV
jgi:hypothetical protein